jgi:AraC-like DNA-binding protein
MATFPPSPALAGRVAALELVDSEGGEATVLPGSGAVFGLQLRGRVHGPEGPLSPAGVTGLQQSARTYRYQGRTTSLLVRFTPQGASCLGPPASELFRRSVPLEQLLAPALVRRLLDRVLHARGLPEQLAALEELLLGLPYRHDPRVDAAVALLGAAGGEASRVAAVAQAVGLGERQLERLLLARTGVTPKRLQRLLRLERAVALARSAPLTAAALEAGYSDQSHFIRDFRAFSGAAPGSLLRRR